MSASEFVSAFFTPTSLFVFLNLIISTIYVTSRLSKQQCTPRQVAPLGRAPSSLIDRVRSIDLSFYKFERHPEPHPVHYHYNPGMDSTGAPSLLDRFRSIYFHQKKFEHLDQEPEQLHPAEAAVYNAAVAREQPPLSRAHSLLDRLKSINFYHQKSDHETDAEPVNSSNRASLARAPSPLESFKSIKFPSLFNPGKANIDTESDRGDVDGPVEDNAHGPMRRISSDSERIGQQGGNDVEVEEINAKADDFIQRFRHQLRLQRLDSLMQYKDLLTGGGAGGAR